MTAREHPIDWERIEAQYRTSILSTREIAKEHGVTEGAVRKRAKASAWERDLSAKVAQKVRTALVRSQSTQPKGYRASAQTERETVEEAAAVVVHVVREHRVNIGSAQRLVTTLREQLELAVGSRDIFQTAIEEMAMNDASPNRYNALARAVALPTLIVAAKDLAHAMRTLIGRERQAFGLAELQDPTPPETTTVITPTDKALANFRERAALRMNPRPEA